MSSRNFMNTGKISDNLMMLSWSKSHVISIDGEHADFFFVKEKNEKKWGLVGDFLPKDKSVGEVIERDDELLILRIVDKDLISDFIRFRNKELKVTAPKKNPDAKAGNDNMDSLAPSAAIKETIIPKKDKSPYTLTLAQLLSIATKIDAKQGLGCVRFYVPERTGAFGIFTQEDSRFYMNGLSASMVVNGTIVELKDMPDIAAEVIRHVIAKKACQLQSTEGFHIRRYESANFHPSVGALLDMVDLQRKKNTYSDYVIGLPDGLVERYANRADRKRTAVSAAR